MTSNYKSQRIGVLVGGGPAPGINSVIHAVTMEAYRNHCEVVGIYEGFKHLISGELKSVSLTPEKVAYIYGEGGSIIHSARANPARSPAGLEQSVKTLQAAGITSLVSIGGDDTAYSASQVARYAQEKMGVPLQSAHVPKTIDNDLPLPGDIPTFGYETARELGTRLVMNLKRDAATIRHWFLVLSMGRQAGHLALGIGQSATAAVTLIPEEWPVGQVRLQEVLDMLVTSMLLRMLQGKPYGVAVLAEGILENLVLSDLESLAHVERDEHGHIRLPDINFLDILKNGMDRELAGLGLKMKMVKHMLGYELRCAPPNAYDIEYTRSLGGGAVDFLLQGKSNAIITLQQGQIVPIAYQDIINPETGRTAVRNVDINSYRYQSAYKFMTRLKPEHAHDEVLFENLAGLTTLSKAEFKDRYAYLTREK
ncbi:MAG: 6-phosphofructokinase [Anaerolineae bacterium]|nr:6-phosphofructokinase [Anaerolineae bacterium]